MQRVTYWYNRYTGRKAKVTQSGKDIVIERYATEHSEAYIQSFTLRFNEALRSRMSYLGYSRDLSF